MSQELMLYPAKISTCRVVPHVFELSGLHVLLARGAGNASCPLCRAAFKAKDIQICFVTHKEVIAVVKKAFGYFISTGENLLLIRRLNKELRDNIWNYLATNPVAPLSSAAEKKIFDKTPLSIEEVRTIYPAFRSVCEDLNDKNDKLATSLTSSLRKQLANGKIDQTKYSQLCNNITKLSAENTIVFKV